jgi:uncharacterized membrane protein YkvA (DUF1232 family)
MFKKINNRSVIQSQDGGLVKDVILYVKLIWSLMTDKRVNFFLKLLPVGALIYLVSPIDLVSGMVLPVIGALDDAAVIWIGTSLFLNLCPEDVVEEHMQSLKKGGSLKWQDLQADPEIVDGEARDVTSEQTK